MPRLGRHDAGKSGQAAQPAHEAAVARRPLERELVHLDRGRRTTHLMRDSLGGRVSAYRDALAIASDTDGRQQLAIELLRSKQGVVLLDQRLALRPTEHGVLCEVITRLPESHRTDAALREEVENAQALLTASSLGPATKHVALQWLVVDDYGSGTVQVWPRL